MRREYIPHQITLSASLPIIHATDTGKSVSDSDIWTHAKEHSLVIVSKDSDSSNRSMVSSPPPWIIHLKTGNLRKHDYHAFLKACLAPLLERDKII
ncbi:MAG: DUF5615 family PIN-like protein [Chthoniobacterales bacterium]